MGSENLLIVQGGGPTPVFNTSLAGVLVEALGEGRIGKIYGARGGIKGLADAEIIDLSGVSSDDIAYMRNSPGAALGSSRFTPSDEDLARSVENLRRLSVHHLIFMGGNGTMRSAQIVSEFCRKAGFEIQIIGVPKTIDNDIVSTDRCPGFASAARFIAQVTIDLAADVRSLPQPVSILETLGRDVGWLAAASTLAQVSPDDAPHLVYIPEIPFSREQFLDDVDRVVSRLGWAVVVVSEGTAYADGAPVFAQTIVPVEGAPNRLPNRPLIGGVAQYLAGVVAENLGIRCRSEKPGLIGRSCMAHVSARDRLDAELVGRQGVRALMEGQTDQMIALTPLGDANGAGFQMAPLQAVAGLRRTIPAEWLTRESSAVSEAFREYARPLIGDLARYPMKLGL